MSNPLDQKVLDYLRTIEGSTAWAMCGQFGGEPGPVKQALQRLKRKGLVECSGTSYWKASGDPMSAVVIVVTWSVHFQHYQVEGVANGKFASCVGDTYEQALALWRDKTGYFGEVKK